MQTDFCGKGGYIDLLGYDIGLTRACIGPIQQRAGGDAGGRLPHPAHARGAPPRSVRPARQQALALAADARQRRGRHRRSRAGRAHPRPRRAGLGHHPRARAAPGEPIIDKPGKGSFCATDLDLILRQRGIANLVLTGITTDVCVHTTMREANDRGYECLLLEDCCGATDFGNHAAAIKMVKMQNGVFGSVSSSARCSRRCRERRGSSSPGRDGGRLGRAAAPWRRSGSPSGSARCSRSTTCRSASSAARSTRCSARTAPARARSSSASWATTGRTPAG